MAHYTDDEASLLAVAAHEVGHAIACAAAGITVYSVRLWNDRGQVHGSSVDSRDQAAVDGYLVMLLAGWSAGAEWLHRNHGFSRSAALSRERRGARSDWADFRRKKRHGSHSSGWYERQAHTLVRANWGRIDRLAHKLVADGRLSGRHFT